MYRIFEGFSVSKVSIEKIVNSGVDVQTLLHLKSTDLDDFLRDVVQPSYAEKLAIKAALNKAGKKEEGHVEEDEKRSFFSGHAVNLRTNYYVPWSDLDEHVADITRGRWLLLTAPWQSGKTSLLKGLTRVLRQKGYCVVTTTLSLRYVKVANNTLKSELEAANDFFELLIQDIVQKSDGKLQVPPQPAGGGRSVAQLFQQAGQKVIWFVDEAQMLTEIYHSTGYAAAQLLTDLRNCKQSCRPREPEGDFWLWSFCLCGLPRLSGLIGDLRNAREKDAFAEGRSYVSTMTPVREHDPVRPWRTVPPSALSVEVRKRGWYLKAEEIKQMLTSYAADWRVVFSKTEDGWEKQEHEEALEEICSDIYGLTLGHKGLTGCCCEFLQRRSVASVEKWQQLKRAGELRSWALVSRAYDQMLVNVAAYSAALKSLIVECIMSPNGTTDVVDLNIVLEALDDGVLVQTESFNAVTLSSPLLLSSIIESCHFAAMEDMPDPTDVLLDAYASAVTLMREDDFMRPKVVNRSTNQPSEYIIQAQFLLGLKFVLEKGVYVGHKYRVLVETKMDSRLHMDFSLENEGSDPEGIEIEVAGNEESIVKHISKSDRYRKLFACNMHYMYFWFGTVNKWARTVIEREACKYPELLSCWYVEYSGKTWVMHRFDGATMAWLEPLRRPAASEFPRFFLDPQPLKKKQRLSVKAHG